MHVGLGPIGAGVLRQVASRPGFEVAAAVDIDPRKIDRDVGEICSVDGPIGVEVSADLDAAVASGGVDVAVLCTASSLAAIVPQLATLAAAGLPVVSTTEELSYPLYSQADLARQVDDLARRAGVAIVGTGVNPGFAMDTLPIALTAVCERVDTVTVDRVQDASSRRLPFQRKIGAGLDEVEFREQVAQGRIRHVGLPESIAMIAEALGWRLDQITDVVEPWIAEQSVASAAVAVAAGQAAGLMQDGIGYRDGEPIIRLHMEAYLGAPDSYDRVRVAGLPAIDSRIDGGIHGDIATASITVNMLRSILSARPGLRTMRDLPVPCWWSGGESDPR
jgi:4-hydroxy-tetrahydrodipicolinate reductase